MTLAEAQTIRTAIVAALPGVYAGGVASYTINGRTVTRFKPADLLKDLAMLDNLIARLQNGVFTVAQFRCPE